MKKLLILALMVLSCSAVFAQSRVTGKVTSSQDGTPIPFASVVIKGTMTGVASNEMACTRSTMYPPMQC